MNQRRLLAIAAALTAFLLVVTGALAARLVQPEAPAAAVVAPAATTANDTASLDPAIEALIRERESAYQKALAEANQRLQEANRQLAQLQGAGATTAATTPNYVVSAEEAVQIATTYRGGGTVRTVEQEQAQGILIYDVQFTDGADVYVDATSGNVVYASLNMSAEHNESTGEGYFTEGDHDHDHDGDDDESAVRLSPPDQYVSSRRHEDHDD